MQACFFIEYRDPAQQQGYEDGGGQQPACHNAAGGIARDNSKQAVVLAGEEYA